MRLPSRLRQSSGAPSRARLFRQSSLVACPTMLGSHTSTRSWARRTAYCPIDSTGQNGEEVPVHWAGATKPVPRRRRHAERAFIAMEEEEETDMTLSNPPIDGESTKGSR